jgi:RHS repeat-associated protein
MRAWLQLVLFTLTLVFSAAFTSSAQAQVQEVDPPAETSDAKWLTVPYTDGVWGFPIVPFNSPQDACQAQFDYYAWPNAVYFEPSRTNAIIYDCNWERNGGGPGAASVQLTCLKYENGVLAKDFSATLTKDGKCIKNSRTRDFRPDHDCEDAARNCQGGPKITAGNPISLTGAVKIENEIDFASGNEDIVISRRYRSKLDYSRQIGNTSLDGFGVAWRGVLPGKIAIGSSSYNKIEFMSEFGSVSHFCLTSTWTVTNTGACTGGDRANRLKVQVLGAPSVTPSTYFRNLSTYSSTNPLEIVVTEPTGRKMHFKQRQGDMYGHYPTYYFGIDKVVESGGAETRFEYDNLPVPVRIITSGDRVTTIHWKESKWSNMEDEDPVSQEYMISKIDLPDGTFLNYFYASSSFSGSAGRLNLLVGVTRTDAQNAILWSRTYRYDDPNNAIGLTAILDSSGNTISNYEYAINGDARVTEKVGGVERYEVVSKEIVGDPNKTVRYVTNPLGRTERYLYDHTPSNGNTFDKSRPNRLVRVDGDATATVPADTKTFGYTTNLYLEAFNTSTDARGYTTAITPDSLGRPTKILNALGTPEEQKTEIVWHPQLDKPTRITVDKQATTPAQGLETNLGYEADGALNSVSEKDLSTGEVRTTTIVNDGEGRVLAVNGPLAPSTGPDDVVDFAYDTAGNLASVENAVGHSVTYPEYDAVGRPLAVFDANNVRTEFTYDALGRVTQVRMRDPAGAAGDAVTSFGYDGEGRVTSFTAPDTAPLTMQYDPAGRLERISAPTGDYIAFEYDGMSNITAQKVWTADGQLSFSLSQTYDSLGRVLSMAVGANAPATFNYDKNGNATAVRTPLNQETVAAFDGLNRLRSETSPVEGTQQFTYGKLDALSEFTDGKGVETTFNRNAFGEVTAENSPDRGTSTYSYDLAGNVVSSTDGRGQTVTYRRDILGRLVAMEPVGQAGENVQYGYDTGAFGVGRLSSVTDATGSASFSYDYQGNVTAKTTVFGPFQAATGYSYDRAGRIASITYPSGRIVYYDRDAEGRVLRVRTRAAANAPELILADNMVYQPFGGMKQVNLGNGTRVSQLWSTDGRITRRTLLKIAGNQRLSQLNYFYDANGNFTTVTNVLDATKTLRLQYDAADRLTQVKGGGGSFAREDYTYDTNGNRLRVERRVTTGAAQPTEFADYTIAPGTNRLSRIDGTGVTRVFTHDARGNLIGEARASGPQIAVQYDAYGRLKSYSQIGTLSINMAYNGLGERVQEVRVDANGTDTRHFVYDNDGRLLGEYGATSGDIKAEHIWLLPELSDGGLFGGDDGQGGWAPLAVATPTATGGTQIAWVYGDHLGVPLLAMDAGGQQLALSGFAVQGFPGQRRTLPDLYYNRYRDYDPSTGRYIQADPIGLAGGASPYGYAMNNPLRYTDPTGEFVPIVIIGGIAMGVGTELIFQGADNWYNGRNIWDPDCYDWGEVAFSGGIGGFGGTWIKGMVRMTPGSMVWGNVSRRIRRAENMIGVPEDLHHWLVPRRLYKGKAWAERIFNRPWNLNRVERGYHRRLHKMNRMARAIGGAPKPVQGAAVYGTAGTAGELSDGQWE